jgi:hypothetical protein
MLEVGTVWTRDCQLFSCMACVQAVEKSKRWYIHMCVCVRAYGWCSSLNMLCVVKHDNLFSGTHTA